MLSSANKGLSSMKRFLALALLIGGSTLGLVGCGETSSDTKKEEIKTPDGSTTVTTKTEVEKTGEHKDPAPEAKP
jgi:hypothetical protein